MNQEQKDSFLTRIIIKGGLAKDRKQANYVLVSITLISLLTTAFVLLNLFGFNPFNLAASTPTKTTLTEEQKKLLPPEVIKQLEALQNKGK